MDEIILQDIEGIGDNDRCVENGEGYQEVGRRSKYNDDGSERIHSNGKHQQQNNECYKYCSNIGRPLVPGSK